MWRPQALGLNFVELGLWEEQAVGVIRGALDLSIMHLGSCLSSAGRRPHAAQDHISEDACLEPHSHTSIECQFAGDQGTSKPIASPGAAATAADKCGQPHGRSGQLSRRHKGSSCAQFVVGYRVLLSSHCIPVGRQDDEPGEVFDRHGIQPVDT